MPTFAFLSGPPCLTAQLLSKQNAPLPLDPETSSGLIHSFGNILDARLLSMLRRSTSELLRTL